MAFSGPCSADTRFTVRQLEMAAFRPVAAAGRGRHLCGVPQADIIDPGQVQFTACAYVLVACSLASRLRSSATSFCR